MKDMMLVVDDVEMNRAVLKVIFEKQYDILEAESGEEALAMLEACQGSIDIVLLDLMMAGMSGFDVLEERKHMDFFTKIPVVVMTGSEQLTDQVKAFDMGANEYISKPFLPEIVLSRVNNVMTSNRRMLSFELEAEKMKMKSELDEMTGLFNKTTTEYAMDAILKSGDGNLNVMMVLDIDNFKTVNDTLGHQTGDHVIKTIANLISGTFRKSDIVGRIGGDEFCVLLVNVPNMEIVYSKLDELIQVMKYKPNLSIPDYVTLSIGVATNGDMNTSYANLFKKADEALYDAKEAGKAQYREYGVEPVNVEADERPVAVLVSGNRNVYSVVQAMIPAKLKILEVAKLDELDKIEQEYQNRAILMYVDVSDMQDATSEIWDQVKKIDWIDISNVFAICQEGNIPQYMEALKSGVADMFKVPIDHDAFRRRTLRQLEKLGYMDGKDSAVS